MKPALSKCLKVVICGASGHGKVIAEAAANGYNVIGFLDEKIAAGTNIDGVCVLGNESTLSKLVEELDIRAALLGVGDNFEREALAARLASHSRRLDLGQVVHSSAIISPSAEIGAGTAVLAAAVIGVRSSVGRGCILNTAATLDHDCVLGDFASLGPGVHVGGGVVVENGAFIGIGASVKHGVRIGSRAVIGAGSVVLDNIPSDVIAFGCPARIVRSKKYDDKYL